MGYGALNVVKNAKDCFDVSDKCEVLLWCECRMWGLLQCEWNEELSWTYCKASLGLTCKIYKRTIFDRAT